MERHYLYDFDVQQIVLPARRTGTGSPEKLRDVLEHYPWCNSVTMTPADHGYHVRVDAKRGDVGDVLLGRCGLHGFRIETVPTMVESDD